MVLKCLHENNEIKGKLHRMSGVYRLKLGKPSCWVFFFLLMKMQIFVKKKKKMTGRFNEVMKSLSLVWWEFGRTAEKMGVLLPTIHLLDCSV